MTANRLAISLALLMSGCADGPVPIHLTGAIEAGDYDMVEDAIIIHLGLPVELVDYEYGAIQLEMRDGCDQETGYCGRARRSGLACHNRKGWSARDERYIAHEVGHMLGMRHVEDDENVMFHAPGVSVTDEQVDDMRYSLDLLLACRPGSDLEL